MILFPPRDGETDTKDWVELISASESQLLASGRPLIGNSVLRIWRDTRMPYALAKTQSAVWDILPVLDRPVAPLDTSLLAQTISEDSHVNNPVTHGSHTHDREDEHMTGGSAPEDDEEAYVENEDDGLEPFSDSDTSEKSIQ